MRYKVRWSIKYMKQERERISLSKLFMCVLNVYEKVDGCDSVILQESK